MDACFKKIRYSGKKIEKPCEKCGLLRSFVPKFQKEDMVNNNKTYSASY